MSSYPRSCISVKFLMPSWLPSRKQVASAALLWSSRTTCDIRFPLLLLCFFPCLLKMFGDTPFFPYPLPTCNKELSFLSSFKLLPSHHTVFLISIFKLPFLQLSYLQTCCSLPLLKAFLWLWISSGCMIYFLSDLTAYLSPSSLTTMARFLFCPLSSG